MPLGSDYLVSLDCWLGYNMQFFPWQLGNYVVAGRTSFRLSCKAFPKRSQTEAVLIKCA